MFVENDAKLTSEPDNSPEPESVSPPPADRITRWILTAIGVYTALLVTLLNIFLLGSGKPVERAVILMADGLILFWIVIGGSLSPLLRRKLVPKLTAIPIGWRVRFVLLCTAMALLEEVITTTMTNLAPVFGTTPEAAHITASTNYFVVVFFHSVVVFVPMFIAWALMLSWWKFTPLKVLLLFGITGSIAEASIQPYNLIGGFWVFVYGLMVYLPACTVPQDRSAKPPRWWSYPLAVVLPFPFVVLAAPVVLLRECLGIKFLPEV